MQKRALYKVLTPNNIIFGLIWLYRLQGGVGLTISTVIHRLQGGVGLTISTVIHVVISLGYKLRKSSLHCSMTVQYTELNYCVKNGFFVV